MAKFEREFNWMDQSWRLSVKEGQWARLSTDKWSLTLSELEMLYMRSLGMTIGAIAEHRGGSEFTVKNMLGKAKKRTEEVSGVACNVAELVVMLEQHEMLNPYVLMSLWASVYGCDEFDEACLEGFRSRTAWNENGAVRPGLGWYEGLKLRVWSESQR